MLQELVWRDARLFDDGAERAFRHVAGVAGNGGIALRGGVVPDLVTASGLPVKFKSECLESPHNIAVTKTAEPAHQMAMTSGQSKLSAIWVRCDGTCRSNCISSNFLATSRAISSVSVMVRFCAIKSGTSSEVARYMPSGSFSTCRLMICSMVVVLVRFRHFVAQQPAGGWRCVCMVTLPVRLLFGD